MLSSLGGTATRIGAWTKTTYSYEGAAETLKNYGIKVLKPEQLAYSLAEVEINPQNRIFAYVREDFYDKSGKVIWSKVYNPQQEREINSQAFDEDFYTAIVDTVFRYGETERRKAKDRWITLWQSKSGDGASTTAIADTTTMVSTSMPKVWLMRVPVVWVAIRWNCFRSSRWWPTNSSISFFFLSWTSGQPPMSRPQGPGSSGHRRK